MTEKTKKTHNSLKINEITEKLKSSQPFMALLDRLSGVSDTSHSICGLSGSATALILRGLLEDQPKPVLVVTTTSEEARDLADDLGTLVDTELVAHFPSRQILPYDFKAPVGEIMGRRISTLNSLINRRTKIVIAPIRALMEPTMNYEALKHGSISFKVGDEIELDDLVERLVTLGFRRVPNVEEVGDFALRGGLVDFFSPGDEVPVRVELFGDEVDSIRQFDVATQRTLQRINQVSLLPKREVPITQETLEEYIETLPEDDSAYIRSRYLNDPELPGLEWLSVIFGLPQSCLLDYFEDEILVFLFGEGGLRTEAEVVMEEGATLYERFKNRLLSLPTIDKYYFSFDDLLERINQNRVIDRLPFKGGRKDIIDFGCQPHPSFGSRLDLLADAIKEYKTLGYDYVITADNKPQADRLKELIAEKSADLKNIEIEVADLKGGFVCPTARFVILTDHQIFNRYHRRVRRKKFKEGVAISDYSSLIRGDYVVHTDHGIARYLGLETLTVDNRNRDCLLLNYADNDKLYVPIEEFNRVSKYAGKDSVPQLTRLGGPGWEKVKSKTKKAIEDMAEDLLKLYAERRSTPGHPFGDDTVWLRQLEASFPYDETPDQLKAIVDVKNDMKIDSAMDRLICGDVGFGKTEVAIRAAFKAIEKGKQVAVLVPTTVLAQQHYHTFKERLAEFPVRIDMLSRFRTKKEQEKTVEDLATGQVDLVVGTHRLFSKDIHFSELGLLIVDEEHRFGVAHKEKLRKLKANVDTLSMTATPIPRTLQMSLMGVRDMSLITTSPKDRLPIITEIVEFDPVTIATVILREIDRGGQVFFVHNRVQTIEAMYQYIKKIVPQAEIAIAHGQMHEKSLEGIMVAFMAKRYNVLLCTSIIESGLDIPSANTIIINRADRFGLAQLYQLRGRVGRSSQRAYAYLMTPPMRLLKADAVKRLRALEAHSDLGSGFALAMRDLEIRGAGTILGSRQSGYIEDIGYDLYNKLLEEAIARLRGMEKERPPDTKLETDIEMFLPNEYIPDRHQKVDIYRRLADSTSLEEVEKIRDEVLDRFGKLPQSSENLFDGTAVKITASALEMEKVKVKRGMVNLFFKENRQLKREEVENLRKATDCPMEFSLTGNIQIIIDMKKINSDKVMMSLRGMLGQM